LTITLINNGLKINDSDLFAKKIAFLPGLSSNWDKKGTKKFNKTPKFLWLT